MDRRQAVGRNRVRAGYRLFAVGVIQQKLHEAPPKSPSISAHPISSKSSGQCWSMTTYCPVPGPVPTSPANRGYTAGFTAAMMLKDLNLAQDAATAAGAKTPLGADAARVYAQYVDSEAARFLRDRPHDPRA
jgi:hypothetical protein